MLWYSNLPLRFGSYSSGSAHISQSVSQSEAFTLLRFFIVMDFYLGMCCVKVAHTHTHTHTHTHIYIYIYIHRHFQDKVTLFPKFENSPGSLLLNTVTQILALWKILIQYKILDVKHTIFSAFCPQSSTFKKIKKYMFFMIFINHFLTFKRCCNEMKCCLYLSHIHS